MDYALKESSTKFETILGTALKVPGVRAISFTNFRF